MYDYIDYFKRTHYQEKKGVSTVRNLDWWMGNLGKKIFKLLFILLLLFFAVFLKFFWDKLNDERNFPTQKIRLQGSFLLTNQADVDLALSKQEDRNFLNMNLSEISGEISKLPWVKTVKSKRLRGNQIAVVVDETQPVFRWNLGYLIDDQNNVFKNRLPGQFDYLPLLDGPWGKSFDVVDAYSSFREMMDKHKQKLAIDKFEMNQYRSIVMYLNDGLEVKFGRDQFSARAKRFVKAFKDNKLPNLDEVSVIDMRYKNGFSVKWKAKKNKKESEHQLAQLGLE